MPWTAVHDYGILYGMDSEEIQDLEFMIREMDSCYLKWRSEQSKS